MREAVQDDVLPRNHPEGDQRGDLLLASVDLQLFRHEGGDIPRAVRTGVRPLE